MLYDGPSLYDGRAIVQIAVGLIDPSRNTKTGACIQVHTLLRDVDPITARRLGYAGSICGDCPLREGACYVVLINGVLMVWKSFHAGKYPDVSACDVLEHIRLSRWFLRGGAYGNQSAVPFEVTEQLLEAYYAGAGSHGHSSYLHDWRTCDQRHAAAAMASVETVEGALEAHRRGWRFYLSMLEEEAPAALEALADAGIVPTRCPYRADDPTTPQCRDCGLCDGKRGDDDRRAHIWNPAHGSASAMSAYKRMRKSLPVLAEPAPDLSPCCGAYTTWVDGTHCCKKCYGEVPLL